MGSICMLIDFTTTAMDRPDLLAQTYASFRRNLRGVDWLNSRLFLNIDPLDTPSLDDCERVARQYFGSVHPRRPAVRNFAGALKWCWVQPTTPFFFHLEDDWLLRDSVDVSALVRVLEDDPVITSVSLRCYPFPPGDSRICLSPGLFRRDHAIVLASRLSLDANPEQQLRPISTENQCGGAHAGYIGRQFGDHRLIEDIGRNWMTKHGWRKEREVRFNRWMHMSE